MLTNGKLLRVDVPAAASGAGDVTFANGPALAINCLLDEVTSAQRFVLGVIAADAVGVLYVSLADSPPTIEARYRVTAQLDGSAAKTYQVIYVRNRVLGEVSHLEVYLKGV
jgi:hypothetical protein